MFFFVQVESPAWLEPELRQNPNLFEDWMALVFLVCLVCLAYVRVAYSKRLQRIYNSLVRVQILKQVLREEIVFSHRTSAILFLNFSLIISLIAAAAAKHYSWNVFDISTLVLYCAILDIVVVGYLLKLLIAYLLRNLLGDGGLWRDYLYIVFLVNEAAGILFLPFALGAVFLNVGKLDLVFISFLAVLFILVMYRLLQGVIISVGYSVPKLYIILYLCTLEIMPLLVVFGVLFREIA